MSAAGFLDADAARRAMRRIRLRERLRLIEASCTTLLDGLDHASQQERDFAFVLTDRNLELAERDRKRAGCRVTIDTIKRQDVREQELLQGADLILQLLDAMLDGVRHGLFSVQNRSEPTAADSAAHSQIESLK